MHQGPLSTQITSHHHEFGFVIISMSLESSSRQLILKVKTVLFVWSNPLIKSDLDQGLINKNKVVDNKL